MLKSRRRNFRQGGSTVLTIPALLDVGEVSTVAADEIMLVDPRGRIHEDDLLQFLREVVEPEFWKRFSSSRPKGQEALSEQPRESDRATQEERGAPGMPKKRRAIR